MEITKICLGLTIGDLKFGNVRPGVVEATIGPNETMEDKLDELDDRLNAWHRKRYPHLYEQSSPPQMITKGGEVPVIEVENGEQESVLGLIQGAPTLDILGTFKIIAGQDPDLTKAYVSRLKELSV